MKYMFVYKVLNFNSLLDLSLYFAIHMSQVSFFQLGNVSIKYGAVTLELLCAIYRIVYLPFGRCTRLLMGYFMCIDGTLNRKLISPLGFGPLLGIKLL